MICESSKLLLHSCHHHVRDICLLHTFFFFPLKFYMFVPSLQKELAKSITLEQGKTLADAEGDVFRGLRKFSGLLLLCTHAFQRATYG